MAAVPSWYKRPLISYTPPGRLINECPVRENTLRSNVRRSASLHKTAAIRDIADTIVKETRIAIIPKEGDISTPLPVFTALQGLLQHR